MGPGFRFASSRLRLTRVRWPKHISADFASVTEPEQNRINLRRSALLPAHLPRSPDRLGFFRERQSLRRSGGANGMISVAGVDLEVLDRGQGVPILYLHGGAGIDLDLPLIERMAKVRRVIAPSHPGYRPLRAARLDRQRRRHRPHLSRTDGPDEFGAGRPGRLLARRLDRGRDRHQGAGTPAAARFDRAGRRQDRQPRQARYSRRVRDAAGAAQPAAVPRSAQEPGRSRRDVDGGAQHRRPQSPRPWRC